MSVQIIPLGGLDEIGKNILAIKHGNEIIVIDAGLKFPNQHQPGIDFILPDISYLIKNKEKVKAIFITHGHEDHIGALPYIIPKINVPIYASKLTSDLINIKLKDAKSFPEYEINVLQPREKVGIGKFSIEFFRVCHSIPDAMGIAIRTKEGLIIHTGDFKIDHTPVDNKIIDFQALSEYASEGVLLLCSDSTYAEISGYTPSEKVVGQTLDKIITNAKSRIIVATFASQISRIQQIIDSAIKNYRQIAITGKSMLKNITMATNTKYLKTPKNAIIPIKKTNEISKNQTLILATGSQGEPTSALVKMSLHQHKDIKIEKEDTVIISASPIPGNEMLVSKTIDNLFKLGAEVHHSKTSFVHVHGHASQEELKLMLNLLKPKFFMPIHGEFRHLYSHGKLANAAGVDPSNIFLLNNGYILQIHKFQADVIDSLSQNEIFVKGNYTWQDPGNIMNERINLSKNGIVILSATVKEKPRAIVTQPIISSIGVPNLCEKNKISEILKSNAQSYLEKYVSNEIDLDQLNSKLQSSSKNLIYKETFQRPNIALEINISK